MDKLLQIEIKAKAAQRENEKASAFMDEIIKRSGSQVSSCLFLHYDTPSIRISSKLNDDYFDIELRSGKATIKQVNQMTKVDAFIILQSIIGAAEQ